MNPQNLRIPGPTPVPPEVMEVMQRPMIPHRGNEFRQLHKSLIEKLQKILKTQSGVFVIPGSGSLGWEAAIANTLSPGDHVISFVCGDFGARFAKVAQAYGLNVRTFKPYASATLANRAPKSPQTKEIT